MIKKILFIVLFCLVQNTFGQIALPSMRGVFNSKIPATMFSGGKGYGSFKQVQSQNVCPPQIVEFIFYGGLGYGDQQKVILQTNCIPVAVESIFYGGTGYGDQQKVIVQTACTAPDIESIFLGGTGYGDQQKIVIQTACTAPVLESIFLGGTGYGDQQKMVIQSACTPPVSRIISNGLVLNLDAGNSSSYPGTGTTWTDLSGNGNHGTLINSPTYGSSNGGNFLFNGSNYASLTPTSLPTGTSDRTIIAFVKTPTSMGHYQHIIHWGSTSNNQAFGLAFVNNQISTHIWGPCPTQGGVNVSSATNYCFATTYTNTGTLHKFWINGVSQGSGVSYSINTGTADARVGMRITGSEGWGPSGQIYQVLVYNRALSDAEIQQVFDVQRGRFGL